MKSLFAYAVKLQKLCKMLAGESSSAIISYAKQF